MSPADTNIEITDRSLVLILLLEECNFACPHCVRGDEPMAPGYRLTHPQLRGCLDDCRRLPSVSWVHFTGGEPTLWEEEGRDLVDLLLTISGAGLVPGFTSNGSAFLEYEECERLLGRYLDATTAPLRLYLSVDTYHGNFDPGSGRARCLDHVLECRRRRPDGQRLETRVLTTVSKDPGSRPPDGMVAHYEALGAEFIFVPLRPAGRARALAADCPEPEPAPAGDRASHLNLIGDEYHVLLDGADLRDGWRTVGRLGALPDWIVRQYSGT